MSTPTRDDASDPTTRDRVAAVVRLALGGGRDVLDIGSGSAHLSQHLASEHGRSVTWVDQDVASMPVLANGSARAVRADLESTDWHRSLAGTSYDVVILAGADPRLRRTGAMLSAVREEKLLRPDGSLVVSVPNPTHRGVAQTLDSLGRLLEASGFVVDTVEHIRRPSGIEPHGPDLDSDMVTHHVVVGARVSNEPTGLIRLRSEVADGERARRRLEAELTRARGLLTSERAEYATEVERRTTELVALEGRAGELDAETTRLARQVARLEAEKQRVRDRKERAERQRDRARKRAERLQAELRRYEGSRAVRLAARLSRGRLARDDGS
ncbi:MAG: hypothetical protein WKF79_08045 [Nocardioides sp.]